MSSNAIKTFSGDVSKLHQAQGAETKAKTAEAKADKAEDTDRSQEKTALAGITAQAQSITDQFEAGGSTMTPAQQQALLGQMYSLGEKQVQTQDSFTTRLADDKKTIAKDAKTVATDKKDVTKDYNVAKSALRPAEYDSSLSQTNKERKELGLGAVKKTIRPTVEQTVPGQVGKWIAEAQTDLAAAGVPLSKMNAADINLIIQHESSGNPNAVNNWDINAQEGHPSEGLMQTIAPTFNEYKLPGHNDITNPVDNIIAGVRYAIARYGSISNVPGVVAVHQGLSYVGY